jgi:uncharacterized protein involved in exopolysaccharide biosynthesis
MQRALEVIFRHPIQLLLLMIVLPAISAGVAMTLPRSYQATATLWATQQFTIVGSGGGAGYTPATSQRSVISELLQSRSFALAVANEAGLASTLGASTQSNATQRDDALYADISANVHVTTVGDNIMVITYTNHSPQMAQQVVQATIHNYGVSALGFASTLAEQLLQHDQQQLGQAQQAADTAAQAEASYLAAHPALSASELANDARYTALHAQTQQAQAALATLQNEISTLTNNLSAHASSTDSLYTVLDSPSLPDKPVSRSKVLLLAGGGGVLIGLLAAVMYVVLLMRQDRAVYDERDLDRIMDYPVLAMLPALRPTTLPLMLPSLAGHDDAIQPSADIHP